MNGQEVAEVEYCSHCGYPQAEHDAGASADSFRGESIVHVQRAIRAREEASASGPEPLPAGAVAPLSQPPGRVPNVPSGGQLIGAGILPQAVTALPLRPASSINPAPIAVGGAAAPARLADTPAARAVAGDPGVRLADNLPPEGPTLGGADPPPSDALDQIRALRPVFVESIRQQQGDEAADGADRDFDPALDAASRGDPEPMRALFERIGFGPIFDRLAENIAAAHGAQPPSIE